MRHDNSMAFKRSVHCRLVEINLSNGFSITALLLALKDCRPNHLPETVCTPNPGTQ